MTDILVACGRAFQRYCRSMSEEKARRHWSLASLVALRAGFGHGARSGASPLTQATRGRNLPKLYKISQQARMKMKKAKKKKIKRKKAL